MRSSKAARSSALVHCIGAWLAAGSAGHGSAASYTANQASGPSRSYVGSAGSKARAAS